MLAPYERTAEYKKANELSDWMDFISLKKQAQESALSNYLCPKVKAKKEAWRKSDKRNKREKLEAALLKRLVHAILYE